MIGQVMNVYRHCSIKRVLQLKKNVKSRGFLYFEKKHVKMHAHITESREVCARIGHASRPSPKDHHVATRQGTESQPTCTRHGQLAAVAAVVDRDCWHWLQGDPMLLLLLL